MKYLYLLLPLSIAFSCSERPSEPQAIAEIPMATEAPKTSAVEPQPLQLDSVEAAPPMDNLAAFKEGMDILPDSLAIDYDHIIYGDFNADNKEDMSALVTNKNNGKMGVVIIHTAKQSDYHLFGAGKVINEMDDLKWIGTFEAMPKGESIAPTLLDPETGDILGSDTLNAFTLTGNGIYMHVDEACGGGIIYWTGSQYNWMHLE